MKLLLPAFFVGLSSAAVAQTAVDIVGVRDNFIVAGLAAQKCNTLDDARRDVHDRNFTIVSRRAMESIMQRQPSADPEEVRKQDLAHIEKLQDAALNLIRAEGCKSEKVRALIRMHKMHETVRF
jgi:uncharacterized NAD(P)/FAD-binding protein YdhS